MHAVDGEVRGDGALGGGEALRDHGTAVDAARSRWVPEWAGVGVDILDVHETLVLDFGGVA